MSDAYTFDLDRKQWIESFDNPVPLKTFFPVWGYGDVRAITVTFVRRAGNSVTVEQSLVSAQLGIGTPGGTVLTTATAGTPSAAFAYPFSVNMAQAAVNTYLGSALSKKAPLEFRLSDATGPQRYQTQVTILQQLISDSVSDPIAPEVALTRNEASGIYVPKEWPAGMRMIVTDEATGERLAMYVNNRQVQFDLLG